MAHTCPICSMVCHCRGDIDDIVFGVDPKCECCDDMDDWEYDPDDDDFDDEGIKPHRQE